MNSYIQKQLGCYYAAQTQSQKDDALYRIGSNADVLTPSEHSEWDDEDYRPVLRRKVLAWIAQNS